MHKTLRTLLVGLLAAVSHSTLALSLAPDEFLASRQMACVLAQQSLGQLTEDEYGARTHTLLESFDEQEQDNIIAKALGYYDGLMFDIADDNSTAVHDRLHDFVASSTCQSSGYEPVDFSVSL